MFAPFVICSPQNNGNKMRPHIIIVCLVSLCSCLVSRGQVVAVKTTALLWATGSLNAEPEVKVGQRSTLALALSWNPFTMNGAEDVNLKWKHFMVQPEYRYWFCNAFNGHFIGIHPGYAHYNIGAVGWRNDTFGQFSQSRYQGDVVSVGVGYGFHWILSPHISIEAEAGVGVACTWYDRYCHWVCGQFYEHVDARWFFTPTKLSVSFVYVIR